MNLEYKEFFDMKVEPREDWDLIWVLSGPEISIADAPFGKEETNITRDRLLTAFALSRRVAAVRCQKEVEELTNQDILKWAPDVFYNGIEEQNKDLYSLSHGRGWEREYNFPATKIKISQESGIFNTADQFKTFPEELVYNNRKIALVTSLYHLPRVKRYFASKYNASHLPLKKVVLIPAEPRLLPTRLVLEEERKIKKYF
jgi:hypothetical protein